MITYLMKLSAAMISVKRTGTDRDPGTGIDHFDPGPGPGRIVKNTGILDRDCTIFREFSLLSLASFSRPRNA